MTYHQLINWHEDDHGSVTARVVIADSYDDLFVDVEESTAINAIIINETSEGLNNNAIINQELKFSINEMLTDSSDAAAVAMLKSAESIANTIFIAIIIDDVILFQGVVEQTIEAEDLMWAGAHYSGEIAPLRNLKFVAKTYNAAVIETFTMNDLINGNTDKLCPGIDETWETANVKDRQGYFHIPGGTDRRVCVDNLVNLNDLLRKSADNLEAAITANGLGTISIQFDRTQITGNWHPARWNLDDRNVLWGTQARYLLWEWNEIFQYRSPVYARYHDDYVNIFLDPDGKPTIVEDALGLPDDEDTIAWYKGSPWMSYRRIKILENELVVKDAENNLFSKIDHFLDFVNRIAKEFGMFAKVYINTDNVLQITFINRDNSLGDDIEIKSSDKATIKPTKNDLDVNDQKSISFYWADEGFDLYMSARTSPDFKLFNQNLLDSPGGTMDDTTLFSISPTVKYIPRGTENNQSIQNCFLPHNHVFYDGSTKKGGKDYSDAIGQHSAIYLCVDNLETHDGSEYSPDMYWTPAAAVSFSIGDKDYYFTKFNDFYKFFYKFDVNFLLYEYNLDIPWFYAGKIGSTIDWQSIAIFNRVVLDGTTWSITEVKRNFSRGSTSIVLQSQTRFSYNNAYATEFEDVDGIPGEEGDTVPDYLSPGLDYAEDIIAYDLVILNSSGTYERALPVNAHYHQVAGIAIFDDEDVFESVQKTGLIYSNDFADEAINTLLFLRKTVSGNNWTTTPLLTKTIVSEVVTEDMYLIVGKYVAYKTIELNEGFEPEGYYE